MQTRLLRLWISTTQAGNNRKQTNTHDPEGRYANGNHIHGSSGGDGFLTGSRSARRRTDFRSSIPALLRAPSSGSESPTETVIDFFPAVDRCPNSTEERILGEKQRL